MVILFAAMLVFWYNCFTYDFTQDDAFISFRYAANLLSGDGLVYNHGEKVEGYTNFLWVILLALFKDMLGMDYLMTSRLFGIVAGGTIFYLILLLLKRHTDQPAIPLFLALAILVLSNPSLPYWSIASLETSAFACMALAAVVAEYRKPKLTPSLLVVASLLRPEGVIFFGVIAFSRTVHEKKFPLLFSLFYAIPLLPFLAFKLIYYGSIFPNPYFAKSGLGLYYIRSGLEYVWHFVRTIGVYGVIVLVPMLMVRRLWRRYSLLYLCVTMYIVYIVVVGGDVLKVYRFFLPVVPLLYTLFVVSVIELYSAVFKNRRFVYSLTLLCVTAVSLSSYMLSREHVTTYLESEKNLTDKMAQIGKKLNQYMAPGASLAASTIGMIGYQLLGHRVIDVLGLTDAFIARNPEVLDGISSSWKERRFNIEYLLAQEPDYILFSTNYKPSAPAEQALMLHSEFRHKYNTIGIFNGDDLTVVWRKKMKIEMSHDVIHSDVKFVSELSAGMYFLNRLQPSEALPHFREAQDRLGEEYPVLLFHMGMCYLKLNDDVSAMSLFHRAVAADSLCWEARMKILQKASEEGDSNTALTHKSFLLRTAPWLFDKQR